jgi:hypothetical protein
MCAVGFPMASKLQAWSHRPMISSLVTFCVQEWRLCRPRAPHCAPPPLRLIPAVRRHIHQSFCYRPSLLRPYCFAPMPRRYRSRCIDLPHRKLAADHHCRPAGNRPLERRTTRVTKARVPIESSPSAAPPSPRLLFPPGSRWLSAVDVMQPSCRRYPRAGRADVREPPRR